MIPLAPLPLDTVSIDTSAGQTAQEYLSWIVLVVAVLVFIFAKVKLRYWSLDPEQRRHLSSIRPSITRASWYKVPIASHEERGPRYQQVSKAATGDVDRSRSPRRAVGTLRGAVSARIPELPPLAVRGAVEGVLVLALGVLVMVSREQWESLLLAGAGQAPANPGALVDGVAWLIETTVPGGATLIALAASLGIMLYQALLLDAWFVLGLALITLSVGVVELDRRTPTDLSTTLYPNRRRLALRALVWTYLVWIAAMVGSLYASWLGAVLGLVVLATVVLVVGRGLVERLCAVANLVPPWADADAIRDLPCAPETAGDGDAPGGDLTTLAYVIARQTVGAVAVVTLPVLAYLAVVSIGTGSILGPLLALGAGPWYVSVLVTIAVLMGGAWALATRESCRPAREWLRRRIATGTVRSALIVRGIPLGSAFVGGLIGWAYLGSQFTGGPWYATALRLVVISAVTASVAIGVVLVGRSIWNRVGIWALDSSGESLPPTDQVVEILTDPVVDGNGDELYVARIDGRPLAARSPERLCKLVQTIVDRRFETGETPRLVAHDLYSAAVDRGIVEGEQVYHEVKGDVDTRIDATLADHDGALDAEVMEDELVDEYPEWVVERVIRRKREDNEVGIRNGKYVLVR